MTTDLLRRYGRSPRGERLHDHTPCSHWQTNTVICALRLEGVGALAWAADHLEAAAMAARDLDPGDRNAADRAVDGLLGAADRARRRLESRSALDLYRRGLALAGPEENWGVREARALAGIGEACYWLAEYGAATDALDRAIEGGTELRDDWTLALALRFRGDIAINVDADLDAAEALLARSVASAEALDEPMAIARSLLFQGWVPWTRQQYVEAERIWRRALATARDADDRWAEVRALTSLSINNARRRSSPTASATSSAWP